jgi:NTE family protein
MTRALVLGGGGVTGIAWELGVLLGLRDEGLDLLAADLTVGTSAGAAVGAQILSGVDLADLFARQLDADHHEIAADLDLELLMEVFGELAGGPIDAAKLARVGAHALAATTVPEPVRRAVIEHRLPSHEWPAARLALTAVDAHTGAFEVFDAEAGVPLVDAVAASCAVPGVWPPVTIGGRRFMDGGVRSTVNADLADGHDEVVVLAPLAGPTEALVRGELDERRRAGATVALVSSDAASTAAMGPNALDPAMRGPSAEAGRTQGRTAAAGLLQTLAG